MERFSRGESILLEDGRLPGESDLAELNAAKRIGGSAMLAALVEWEMARGLVGSRSEVNDGGRRRIALLAPAQRGRNGGGVIKGMTPHPAPSPTRVEGRWPGDYEEYILPALSHKGGGKG